MARAWTVAPRTSARASRKRARATLPTALVASKNCRATEKPCCAAPRARMLVTCARVSLKRPFACP
eukprot:1003727-Pyramimonas_sp.AAC.1